MAIVIAAGVAVVAVDQGRNREIHVGGPLFLCTTETAVAVQLSQDH